MVQIESMFMMLIVQMDFSGSTGFGTHPAMTSLAPVKEMALAFINRRAIF